MATGFVGGHVNAPDLYLVATGFLSGHVSVPDLYLVARGFVSGHVYRTIPRGYRFISGNVYRICTLWPGFL